MSIKEFYLRIMKKFVFYKSRRLLCAFKYIKNKYISGNKTMSLGNRLSPAVEQTHTANQPWRLWASRPHFLSKGHVFTSFVPYHSPESRGQNKLRIYIQSPKLEI